MCNGKGWLIKNPYASTKSKQGKIKCQLCGRTGKSSAKRLI